MIEPADTLTGEGKIKVPLISLKRMEGEKNVGSYFPSVFVSIPSAGVKTLWYIVVSTPSLRVS